MTMTDNQTETATDIVSLSIKWDSFQKSLANAIQFASKTTEGRPALSAVRMEFTEGEIRFIATDAHFLIIERLTSTQAEIDTSTPGSVNFLIPVDAAKSLIKSRRPKGARVSITVVNDTLTVEGEGATSVIQGEMATFPDYTPLLPTGPGLEVDSIILSAKALAKIGKLNVESHSGYFPGACEFTFYGKLKPVSVRPSPDIEVLIMPMRAA